VSARAAAGWVAHLLVTPLVLAYRVKLMGFATGSTGLALVPGKLGWALRRAWYERTLAACGEGLVVDFGAAIRVPASRIGDHCYIGLWNWYGWVDIGNDFMSGSHVVALSGRHQHAFDRTDIPMRLQGGSHEVVRIGDDVWVGAQATISADVAAHSVVASNAAVTQTFSEYDILAGVPAKPVRSRLHTGEQSAA
jgi:acetyltransferase-like isoleucine patch superfamily enzyme